MNWYLDEGLATLRAEWKRVHPDAVVYTIGDASHAARDSEHNPERSGPAPGADAGEVDAADFMRGNGVTDADLDHLFDDLVAARDPRLLYAIYDRIIVSSVVQPWKRRRYKGADPHTTHVHVSVNDRYDDNESEWRLDRLMARTLTLAEVTTKLPEKLIYGDDDDARDGYNHVSRAQCLANWIDRKHQPLDIDGVYGPKTAAKMKTIFGGNGKTLTVAQLKRLHGLV